MLPSMSKMTCLFRLFPAVVVFGLGLPLAVAAPVQTPHADAELVVDADTVQGGKPILVALRLEHEPGWHTYWKNPGDSGMPTRITWTLPPGFSAGPILWPVPQRIPVGPLTNYGYGGELLLLSEITPPATLPAGRPLHVEARAEWLICKDVCLPSGATLALDVPAGAGRPSDSWGPRLHAARAAIPASLTGWESSIKVGTSYIELTLVPRTPGIRLPDAITFFPDQPDVIDNAAPTVLERTADGSLRLGLQSSAQFKGKLATLSGIVSAVPGFGGGGVAPPRALANTRGGAGPPPAPPPP